MGSDTVNVSVFSGPTYAGVGWTAPNNTTNDHTDFGFDNFSVESVVPEAGSLVVWSMLLATAGFGVRLRKRPFRLSAQK
jgi:hypothetical protein